MMNYANDPAIGTFELANLIPHCPVVLVLDTSHSMWGQGLIDLQASLKTFRKTIFQESFQEAQIDLETISMGGNFGILEPFTPIAASMITQMNIRPKGDTPIGAALELALKELEKQTESYRMQGVRCVTPQLIVLSDGKSGDPVDSPAAEVRRKTENGSLICHVIALGNNPDIPTLKLIAGETVLTPRNGDLPDTFRAVGEMVSQEYEEKTIDVMAEPDSTIPAGKKYLLDGTNMLFWDEIRQGRTLKHVLAVTDWMKRNGMAFTVYFDATTPHMIRNHAAKEVFLYEGLLKQDPEHFRQVPAGTRADDILLVEADSHPDWIILSQDRYRDYEEQYPWVSDRTRVVPGMVLSDKIVFPGIKLQIPVKAPEFS